VSTQHDTLLATSR